MHLFYVQAHTKAHFQSEALENGAQVISVLLFLDAITLELSITCKINCFSRAIEIDHLMIEAELTTMLHWRYLVQWHTSCDLSSQTTNFIKQLCGGQFSGINGIFNWTSYCVGEINYVQWPRFHSHTRVLLEQQMEQVASRSFLKIHLYCFFKKSAFRNNHKLLLHTSSALKKITNKVDAQRFLSCFL